jgi:hypothetical protein
LKEFKSKPLVESKFSVLQQNKKREKKKKKDEFERERQREELTTL